MKTFYQFYEQIQQEGFFDRAFNIGNWFGSKPSLEDQQYFDELPTTLAQKIPDGEKIGKQIQKMARELLSTKKYGFGDATQIRAAVDDAALYFPQAAVALGKKGVVGGGYSQHIRPPQ